MTPQTAQNGAEGAGMGGRDTETGSGDGEAQRGAEDEIGPLSKVNRGAASELRAGAHLLERGWHVFWAMSPGCPVDMISWRPGETPVRVEVKTLGVYEVSATRRWRALTIGWPTNDHWDLLLAVGPDVIHEVWAPAEYRPTLEIFRAHYGFPPAPLRAVRGSAGLHQPPGKDRPDSNLAAGSEWV